MRIFHRLFPLSHIGILWGLLGILPLFAQDRLQSVEAQIRETNEILATVETDKERETFQKKLDLLKRERDIIQLRQLLREQETTLEGQFRHSTRFRLNDLAQTILITPRGFEEELDTLRLTHRETIQKRTASLAKIQSLREAAETDPETLIEEELRLGLLQEDIRALRNREDLLMFKSQLVAEGERVSEMLRLMPVNPKPSTSGLLASRRTLDDRRKQITDTQILLENLQRQQKEAQVSLELFQAQLLASEDEIRLLESKNSVIGRFLQGNEMLSRARAQRKLLEGRIQLKESQLSSIQEAGATLRVLQDLLTREVAYLQENLEEYVERYLRRILSPVSAIGVLLVLYLLCSRVILPLIYKRDELFNARRLGGYLVGLGAIMVVALYFFDDLQAIATVFGIAGAALVIALQDMLSSIAGWFVIISSRKAKVGDRVEVDGHRGDIIDIQLMRTTMVEVNEWLGVDQPTGRIVAIPNSFIFKSKLVNYSHMHRYLWGSINVLITFESSMEKSREVLQAILEEDSRPILEEARKAARSMEQKYGVADTVYEPEMYITVEDSGINFRLLFIAHYKHVSSTRSRISERIAVAFEQTDGIEFAYPTMRHIPTPEGNAFPVSVETKPS